jgi:NADP-dependent 3-hydroxy acid dehydrogenase YdfG
MNGRTAGEKCRDGRGGAAPAARRPDRLTALVAQITAAGGTARVVGADLTEQDQAREAVDQTVQAWGDWTS